MDKRRLVFSILEFLNSEATNKDNSLSAEAKETLEVANQCLQSSYSLGLKDKHLRTTPGLLEIFTSATSNQPLKKCPTPSPEDKKLAEKLKMEGNDALNDDRMDEAIEKYTEAIELDGCNHVFYCNRAAAYSRLNDHYAAIEDCKRSLDMCPDYSKAYGRMGLAYCAIERNEEAEECFRKALELQPDNEGYKSNLSMAQSKVKAPVEANTADPSANVGLNQTAGRNIDFNRLINDPSLVNMAMSMLSDPNVQNIMGQVMSGGAPGGAADGTAANDNTPRSMEGLLQAGQRLAEQMQQSHPDIVDQLRNRVSREYSSDSNKNSKEAQQ